MKCKACKEDPASCQGLCEDCERLRESFQKMTPARQARFKDAMFQMADDMLDEKFGAEAGTVIN